MARYLGRGNGSDGVLTISSATTSSPIDSSCSGTSGATSLTATNVSFASGQRIFIHQSRGTGVGAYEENQIVSYVAGTITLLYPLENTYTDSGSSQAQVLVMPQYSGVTISDTYSAKSWTGDVGGILPILCNGIVNVTGTLNVSGIAGARVTSSSFSGGGAGIGYNGGNTKNVASSYTAYQGEGTTGASTMSTSANGTGGGGASTVDGTAGGGGGGHATSGSAGLTDGASPGGGGGTTVGAAELTTLFFGGGGGGGARDFNADSGAGGGGGGILYISAKELTGTGTITVKGGDGGDANNGGGGGAGAGGSLLIKVTKANLTSLTVTAAGGTGGDSLEKGGTGGNGGVGRIRIESCSLTGTTTPTASSQVGGYSYCGGSAFLL